MARGERAQLAPEAYYSTSWYRKELDSVFRHNWLYAGMISDFPRNNAWKNIKCGTRSWIVIRTGDTFSCFRNVCSHRHARIVTDDCGCGLLRCGYHGWTYSSEGIPVGLPGQHENFDLSADERKALQLQRGQAMTVGNFVFFRDAESGHPGGDAFPEAVRTLLLQVSETFDIPFLTKTHSWNANWKAGVENTLEPYHAGFVHSGTLAQVIEPPTERTLNYSLSSHKHPLKQVSRDWWERMINLAGIDPSPHFTDYHHFFVYPNLCIGLTYGSLLSVQVFFPISTDRLTLTSTLFLPSSEAKTASRSVRWTMQEFLSEYNDKILLEDRAPVESCQAGFRDASSVAILGESEERIGFFQKAIVRDIEFENGVSRCI